MKIYLNKIFALIIYSIFYIILSPQDVYAYIDPGTTNLIVSAIIALFATIGYYFRIIVQKIKEYMNMLRSFFIK